MKRDRVSGIFCAGVFLSALFIFALGQSYAEEGETVLKGAITDVDGQAVQGARVFVYDSPEVKRTADFISAPSDKDGLYRIVLPPGKYWAVARLKQGGDYGPLGPGDKHSGEALEFDLMSAREEEVNFTVADLREAIKSGAKKTEDLLKIKGRIIDESGSPVKGAYATANRAGKISGFPDYLSAWTDSEGGFTLYVPRGTYFIGSATAVPPGGSYMVSGEMTFEDNRSGLEITRKSSTKK